MVMIALWDLGIQWIVWLQGLGDWLRMPMEAVTFLGSEDFYVLILPVLYWSVDAMLGLRVGIILLLTGGLNNIIKISMRGPRPYWYDAAVRPVAGETSFGVPSGHSQLSVGVWGVVAAHLRRGWAWIAAAVLVFLIGMSRLYLGVHFPHDVLLGWLIGGLVLWAFLKLWDPVAGWLKRQSFAGQVLVALGVSLLLVVLGILVRLPSADWAMPESWLANAVRAGGDAPDPFNPSGFLTPAGTLFGLALGFAWLYRQGGFSADGPFWQRLVRFVIGLAGVLAIRFGLKAIFPDDASLLAYALHYVRYFIIGLWISGLAPWIFLRIRIAHPVDS